MRLTLDECGILPRHAVLAALSGGVDSVVLLHLLCAARREGRIARVAAAHLHHGLRGAAADEDAAFCAELCRRWDVPFLMGRADVRAAADERGLSLEAAAREERYAFLRDAAHRLGADCIATGHHMDDQAETVLLHLLRGSGLAGLCGMRPRTGDIARPLLAERRAGIEAYAVENGLTWRTDLTNDSPDMLRNRVRHELLPLLVSLNPAAVERLASTAQLLRQDEAFLSSLAAGALREAAADGGGYGRAALLALDGSVRSRALKRLLLAAQPDGVQRRDVERLDALLTAQTGTRIELRGGRAAWVDSRALHVGLPPQRAAFEAPLAVPGRHAHAGGRVPCARGRRDAPPKRERGVHRS